MDKPVEVPLLAFKPRGKDIGVYKLWLGEYFYIGSSVNLADRIRKHLYAFIKGTNYKMLMDKYNICNKIKFEIIGSAPNNDQLRKLETVFIATEIGNPFLLNKSDRTKMVVGFSRQRKMIKKISPDGSIEIFASITEAAKDSKAHVANFKYNVRMGYKTKGCSYRIIDAHGNEIIGTYIRPETQKPYEYKFGPHKPIIDLETGIFWTSTELGKILGMYRKQVCRMLAEERRPNKTQYRYA